MKAGGYELAGSKMGKAVFLHAGGALEIEVPEDSGGTTDPDGGKKGWSEWEMLGNRPFTTPVAPPGYTDVIPCDGKLRHGSVVIAAITSCTNTSNPRCDDWSGTFG